MLIAISAVAVAMTATSWGVAAARRGTPPAHDPETVTRPLLLSGADAGARRLAAIRRARVTLPDHPDASLLQRNFTTRIDCRFLPEEPQGTSAKFDCVLADGTVIKVKYGRNPEIQAEVAASRLLTMLGFPADRVALAPRLRCYGCPRFPFFTMRVLTLIHAGHLLEPHGHDDGYTDFEWVAVEPHFPSPSIETSAQKGWAWFELDQSSAPAADVDALRLLAVFLAHWDNKSSNQRLVCLDPLPAVPSPDTNCSEPMAMIQDLGSTFGPYKVNLANWQRRPIWADRATCTVSMADMPFAGGTFIARQISEAGRQRLASRLASLRHADIRQLFAEASFPEYHSGTADTRDLDAWTSAFADRVDQIARGTPCPEAGIRIQESGG